MEHSPPIKMPTPMSSFGGLVHGFNIDIWGYRHLYIFRYRHYHLEVVSVQKYLYTLFDFNIHEDSETAVKAKRG